MGRQSFAAGIKALYEMQDGYYRYRDDSRTHYRDGFFRAVSIWISFAYEKIPPDVGDSDFDAQAGFRHVVDAHDGFSDEPEEFVRGYEQALIIFREAKGL